MDEIYKLLGRILKTVQYIEWNLSLLVAKTKGNPEITDENYLFRSMQEMTLGEIVSKARKTEIFSKDTLDKLENILNERNYLVHQFFKRTDFQDEINDEEEKAYAIKRLTEDLSSFKEFNEWLSNVTENWR